MTECKLSKTEMRDGCRLGLDSHADTICVGRHAAILEVVEGMTVEAIPFAKSIGSVKNLPIVNAALAYDHPTDGQTYILICNQAIYLGEDSDNCLLCPNQCRENGIIIHDVPRRFDPDSPFSIDIPSEELSLPLQQYGPTAYLRVRKPTREEIDECTHIELSDDAPWDPYGDVDNGFGSGQFSLSQIESTIRRNNSDRVFNDNIAHSEHPFDSHILWSEFGDIAASKRIINALKIKHGKEATPERIAKLWGCSLPTARRTLEATTHTAYREFSNSTGTITRRFRTRRSQLRYRQLALPHGRFYSDTMFAHFKSIRGFTMAQIYCNSQWFVKPYLMKSKSDVPDTLHLLHQDVGVPAAMHTDGAKELAQGDFAKINRRQGTRVTHTERKDPNKNRAELCIGEVKKLTWRTMAKRNVPVRLWCFALEYECQLLCLTASPIAKLQGRTSYEHVFGHTPDISEYIEFAFYDWVWYWDDSSTFPQERKLLGRWLGVAHKVGQGMCYYILNENAKIITRTTVSTIADDEQPTQELKEKQAFFTQSMDSKIGNFRNAIVDSSKKDTAFEDDEIYTFCLGLDPSEIHGNHTPADPPPDNTPPIMERDREELDQYIGARVSLPGKDGESTVLAQIKHRKRDSNGIPLGQYNDNPILDTRIYEVEFPDGHHAEFAANVIAENIYSQVESDGHNFSYLQDIIGHRSDDTAVQKEDGFVTLSNGHAKPVVTTQGWDINVRWADQSTSWVSLADIKQSNPVEVAEYMPLCRIFKMNLHFDGGFPIHFENETESLQKFK